MEANLVVHENSLSISIDKRDRGIFHISDTSFEISPLDIPHIAEGIALSINDEDSYSFIRNCGKFFKIYYDTNRDGNPKVFITDGNKTEYISLNDGKKIYEFCLAYINSLSPYYVSVVSVQLKYVKLK